MAIDKPFEPEMGVLTDERLRAYLSLGQFWSPGLGALLACNVDPLVELKKPGQIVAFLESVISDLKLHKLIHRKSNAAQRIISLWQESTQHPLHQKMPAEDFLSWAEQRDLPGIDDFLARARRLRPTAQVPVVANAPSTGLVSEPTTTVVYNMGGPGKRPALYQEIIKAQAQAVESKLDPRNPVEIWGILCKGVGTSSYPRLLKYDRSGIWFPSNHGLKAYTFEALKKYLDPNKAEKRKAENQKVTSKKTATRNAKH